MVTVPQHVGAGGRTDLCLHGVVVGADGLTLLGLGFARKRGVVHDQVVRALEDSHVSGDL